MLPYDFPLYFAGLPFRAHQVGRKLRWLLGGGEIRCVFRDVYVDSRVPDSIELRAAVVALLLGPDRIASGKTAAWVHGIAVTALGPTEQLPLESTSEASGTVEIAGLKVATPVTTAVELASRLPRPFALSSLDAMLRSGIVRLADLRTAVAAYDGRPGIRQARQIVSHADHRAESPGESWLRLRLLDAGFGRPELQFRVKGPHRDYRIDVAYPDPVDDGRRLGLEYDSDRWHSRPPAKWPATKHAETNWKPLAGGSSPSAGQTSGAATPPSN
ncbi:hypothetical protein EV643_107160 [Kribbella sp. VKM Ac-2527]|uniref:Transcriptional regulator with AbiEi antitoxin domain of type IV toxin-antitoxin system n=1 Tax=Kribbella caucasensis TaxID=2512215 RepID=A0A4R6KDI4_9ACTN|nr:hypothetical protein [Kribbella sp. VKM Ac-2527]TDO48531.1 hypothetical protein EV643_107160 [Kribbella sp. VKM Ac-2527]